MYEKDFRGRGLGCAPKDPKHDKEAKLHMWYLDALLLPILVVEWEVNDALKAKAKYAEWPLGECCDLYMVCVPCGAQLSMTIPTDRSNKIRTNARSENPQ